MRSNISNKGRRGVTLLEMLVTVALLMLMMVVIVTIFQAATGAVTVSRAFTLLDQDLRRLDSTIRQDLQGVTAKMTPPNDPRNGRGYFELAENALSDAQDEDSDDTIRFTAEAPPGRPFTGRIWVPKTMPLGDGRYSSYATLDPIPVTSQFAEVIYFQRGDRLYRRVRLILPRMSFGFGTSHTFPTPSLNFGNTLTDPKLLPNDTRAGANRFGFRTNLFEPAGLFPPAFLLGGTPLVSWQGLNDVSARPSDFNVAFPLDYAPRPNTLGDLTDRPNRYASPRFANDFRNNLTGNDETNSGALRPDGLPDDMNGDGVVDIHPTMYWNSKAAGVLNDNFNANGSFGSFGVVRFQTRDVMGFPWVFPNAFTGTGPANEVAIGRIHAIDPASTVIPTPNNHNPLDSGDSLAAPTSVQTWWGFPTWRETMAATWLDPIKRVNDPAAAPFFSETTAAALGEAPHQQFVGLSHVRTFVNSTPFFLPPRPGPFSDGVPSGAQNNMFDLQNAPVFEDDLLAVNVRSFNVKAFDPNPRYYDATSGSVISLTPGYFDLGYASGLNPDHRLQTPRWMLDTLGHEGRIPPLVADNRVDAQHPTFDVVNTSSTPYTISTVPAALGDDNTSVVRLRRVWDSWSTTYTNAPATPLDPSLPYPFCGPQGGFIPGDTSTPPLIARGRAVVPSYPAPYPAPLRGIEIQIRLNSPDNRHIKSLTIRQDFSDKL